MTKERKNEVVEESSYSPLNPLSNFSAFLQFKMFLVILNERMLLFNTVYIQKNFFSSYFNWI